VLDQLFVQEDLWKCGSIVDAFLISASDKTKCKLEVRAVSPFSNVNTRERPTALSDTAEKVFASNSNLTPISLSLAYRLVAIETGLSQFINYIQKKKNSLTLNKN
jgi:hypothetical protein